VPADRQASLDAGHTNRVPLDAGPASNVHLDIGCRIAGDLHFRDQAGNGKHQILMQVTSKDSAATVSNSQHGWQQVVPDDGAIGVVLHVDPNPREAEQPGNDRVASLVIGDLAAEDARVNRA
jgi:hypothetical protein